MEWSTETYRLDELESRFKIPCVIHVNEGFYSETEAEGFSQGDIIGIDRKMTLHKVAANFATPESNLRPQNTEKDYVDLAEEILVPLNYKGKLKVLTPIKKYTNVRSLAYDAPRYATVLRNITVLVENKTPLELQAGTLIELDRVLPGKNSQLERLVVEFKHQGKRTFASMAIFGEGYFRSEKDGNEYTLKEAIDR